MDRVKRNIFRSILYAIFFYGLTAVACLLCLPALLLPRKLAMGIVYAFVHINMFLERILLELRHEVRGVENLPADGSYIIAAKHQSAYETMKLHILFKDPAIILKKELLSIPLWGWYLAKSDVIAIDRTTPERAIESIKNGALRMKEQGRPIIIFPQGTRVEVDATTNKKPYKIGVARIQEATGLPVIPMAMNAGVFWPRNGFFKSKGNVVFEFLKPIKSAKDRSALMTRIEKAIEPASNDLAAEAIEAAKTKRSGGIAAIITMIAVLALLAAGYSALWHYVAQRAADEYTQGIAPFKSASDDVTTPVISGFPGRITLSVEGERLSTRSGSLGFKNAVIRGWPIPFLPIKFEIGSMSILDQRWVGALAFESMSGSFTPYQKYTDFRDVTLNDDEFQAKISGRAIHTDSTRGNIPVLDAVLTLKEPQALMRSLNQIGVLDDRMMLFIGSGLNALRDVDTGLVEIPVYEKASRIYLGPLPVYKLPQITAQQTRRQKPVIPTDPASFAPDLDTPQAPAP